ncbi:MAG: hypothetical protein ABI333_02640 [bacterium]
MRTKTLLVMMAVTAVALTACNQAGESVCDGVECSGHGSCNVDANEQAYCVCEAGYLADGLTCVEDTDPCDGVACSGHGTCAPNAADQPECTCEDGYHAEGLDCVEDTVDVCEDPTQLREDALTNGTTVLDGVTLSTSTPIADINASPSTYEGTVVQVEGWVQEICSSAGCWALLTDAFQNELRLKVVDGFLDLRTVTEVGRYMIGEGTYTELGEHGPQVEIDSYGALVGSLVCPVP